ncbi:conserved exported protein of unknown function [Nitrospira sp. KM1]|nr:conserved exported protein of unknown function [Nitrospira sp. KM1]
MVLAELPSALHVLAEDSQARGPVRSGERFTYELSWLNLVAGTAVMEVRDSDENAGRPSFKLVTTAHSSPTVTRFYPIDNRVESTVDRSTFQSERMIFRRREGKRKNDFEYTFHHQDGTVTAVKDGVSETLSIPAGTLDAISCLYYVRALMPLTIGTSQSLNVHHDKKNYKLEVRVEGLETLKGPWGKLQAARLLVIMPFQGIFLNQGNIKVWLTNDDRRIPLRMKAKVVIGSVVAELVNGFASVTPANN